MCALAAQCVQVDGQRRHQGLALTGLHFCDFALVQHHAANHLNVVVAQAHGSPRSLTNQRKGLRKQ